MSSPKGTWRCGKGTVTRTDVIERLFPDGTGLFLSFLKVLVTLLRFQPFRYTPIPDKLFEANLS